MADETPTIETVKAELAAKLVTAKAELPPLASAVKSAEKGLGDAGVAHAKTPNLEALVAASGKHTEAVEALAGATAAAGRFENKLASIEADVQREADRKTASGIVDLAMAALKTGLTVSKLPKGTKLTGSMAIDVGSLNTEQRAVCERHSVTSLAVVADADAEGGPMLTVGPFFGKVKRASSGTGNGRGRRTFTDDGTVYTPEEYARAFADPASVDKTAAAIADPNKSASFSHLADSTMNKRIAEGHTVSKS